MRLEHTLMETEEYKKLFKEAKLMYPQEYDYFLQVACIAQILKEKQIEQEEESFEIIKSDVIIENNNEIQEISHPQRSESGLSP